MAGRSIGSRQPLDSTKKVVGPSVVDWLPVNDPNGDPIYENGKRVKNDDYWYPNIQSARLMWYHDHAVGITRLNPYLGLASGYILTDAAKRC